MTIKFKDDCLRSIKYFLEVILNKELPLEVRKEEMLRLGSKLCQGFPNWSDIYGVKLSPLDDTTKKELKELLSEITV